MMGMIKFAVVAMAVTTVLACGSPLSRTKRVHSPRDDQDQTEDRFSTFCKVGSKRCIEDAKSICPEGYIKVDVSQEGNRETLVFACHGKPNEYLPQ